MTGTIGGFFGAYAGWTFNYVFVSILFYAFAVTAFDKYGYTDTEASTNADGGIESGPSGSGVFPIVLTLYLVANATYLTFFVSKLNDSFCCLHMLRVEGEIRHEILFNSYCFHHFLTLLFIFL
jgi:hypothetical protein